MKAKDVFGIVVRVIGLFGVIWGIFYLMSSIYYLMGASLREGFTVNHCLVAGGMTTVLGVYFLRGAPHIVRFAYPELKEQKESPHDLDKHGA